jgi:hypothetical protein
MKRDYTDQRLENRRLNDDALGLVLRGLPRLAPGAELQSSLRVLASREQRRASGGAIAFVDRARLFSQNLMRPLALPAAGGVFSAIVLFSIISFAPAYTVTASTGLDVEIAPSPRGRATVLNSDVVVTPAPIFVSGADNVIVDVFVNGQGGMVDYAIVSGNATKDEALQRRIGQVLLLTKFYPATTLGTPHEGRIRLSLSASHSSIDVKG